MNVNDVVAAKIEAARIRAENAKRRRAAFAAARQRGLALRHAQKLARLAAPREGSATPTDEAANDTTEENQ